MSSKTRSVVECVLAIFGGVLIGILSALLLKLKFGDFF